MYITYIMQGTEVIMFRQQFLKPGTVRGVQILLAINSTLPN